MSRLFLWSLKIVIRNMEIALCQASLQCAVYTSTNGTN